MKAPLPDLFGNKSPQTDDEWNQLDYRAADIFSPHSPIDEEELFVGRIDLVEGLIETVFQRGQHAILYGERGVGKTSLANIIGTKLFTKSKRFSIIKRNCTEAHDFKLIWEHLFDTIDAGDGSTVGQNLHHDANAYDIYKCIDGLPNNLYPIFIIDEYDRIKDKEIHIKMADTTKYLSDYSSRATVVIVGVARDVRGLFGGHPSIERNVRQLPMPFMARTELAQIFDKRLPDLGMTFDEDALDTLIRLAQGLPGYTHLLGQNAARNAIRRRSLRIEVEDLNVALYKSIDACDEKIKNLYAVAVRSTKPANQYRQALLACAMAPIDERGYFPAKNVEEPFSQIMERQMKIPHFARHLAEFCDEERGPALVKEGKPKSFMYRFSDALLRPFVVIKGINDGLIPRDAIRHHQMTHETV
jgi:Cdc6-like AAA superfamily ATPase